MICPYRSALIMRKRKSMPEPLTTKFHKPTTLSYTFKLITELNGEYHRSIQRMKLYLRMSNVLLNNSSKQYSLGPVYEFVCISFRTDNLNCFWAS